ncbi:MAG TPA: hypothetical protein VHP37_04300 [Burkholderiales bacterium]|nr:hypothetical protein [Burkholderiales bacterium]
MNAPEPRADKAAEDRPGGGKTCTIFAEPAGALQYGWGWRAGSRRSRSLFRYFYECVQDARRHGYRINFGDVAESLRPARGDRPPGDR